MIIEDGVTSIDGSAFDECNKLTDIYYWGSKEQWNATEFSQTDFAAGLNIYCEGEMI